MTEQPAPPAPTRRARQFRYYLGGRPNWLGDDRFWDVPLMIAAPTLARYRTSGFDKREGAEVPDASRRWGNWFGDSGAFMALTGSGTNRGELHPWWMHPDDYGSMWVRMMDDFGMPDFVAPQDWPCEPVCLNRTGLTVREHIELTVENFLYLREEFPMVPWIPVIQGWEPADYLYCEQLYLDAGVDLAAEPRVGIGSICRRGHVPEIVEVIELFAAAGYRLHGFGVKITALPIIGHLLWSADSYAWSDTARKDRVLLDGCSHLSKADPVTGERRETDCRNCPRWAIEWRRRVLATLDAGGDTRSDNAGDIWGDNIGDSGVDAQVTAGVSAGDNADTPGDRRGDTAGDRRRCTGRRRLVGVLPHSPVAAALTCPMAAARPAGRGPPGRRRRRRSGACTGARASL